MKFEKTNQQDSQRSQNNDGIDPMSSNVDQNQTGSLSSSSLKAIDLRSLRELCVKYYNERKWTTEDNDKVEKLFDDLDNELSNFRLKEAEAPLLKLLKLINSFNSELNEVNWEICEVLAKLYERLNEHKKCKAVLEQSLGLKISSLGEKNQSYILTLIEYANCLTMLNETEQANQIFKEARLLKDESESS